MRRYLIRMAVVKLQWWASTTHSSNSPCSPWIRCCFRCFLVFLSCSCGLVRLDCLFVSSEGWLSGGFGSGILVGRSMKHIHSRLKLGGRSEECSFLLLKFVRWLLNRRVVTRLINDSLVVIQTISSWSSFRFWLAWSCCVNGCSAAGFSLRGNFNNISSVQLLYFEVCFVFLKVTIDGVHRQHFKYHASELTIHTVDFLSGLLGVTPC